MKRSEWLQSLKSGDRVLLVRRGKIPAEMLVRVVSEGKVCMVPAASPKMDLAQGEVVFQDHGEGPFGEVIFPLDQGVLPAIGDAAADNRIGGWEAA